MMADDDGSGVMPPAMALISVSLICGTFSDSESTVALGPYNSSALGDCPVAGIGVSCYLITTI